MAELQLMTSKFKNRYVVDDKVKSSAALILSEDPYYEAIKQSSPLKARGLMALKPYL